MRIGGVLLVSVVAVLSTVADPAVAARPAATRSTVGPSNDWRDAPWYAQARRLQPRAAPLPAMSSGRCDQAPVKDRRGDARVIDIVSTTLTSDCGSWTITMKTAKPLATADVSVFGLDLDVSTGTKSCEGGEFSVLMFAERGRLVAYLVRTPSCDPDRWITHDIGRVTRPDARTVRITFPDSIGATPTTSYMRPSFRWRSIFYASDRRGSDAGTGGNWIGAFLPPAEAGYVTVTYEWTSVILDWRERPGDVRYRVSVRVDGGPSVEQPRPAPSRTSHQLKDVQPGSRYVVSIVATNGVKDSLPDVVSFTIPDVQTS